MIADALYIGSFLLELALLLVATLALPRLIKPDQVVLRWIVRATAVMAVLAVLHARQLYGAALAGFERVPQASTIRDDAFCTGFDLIDLGSEPTAYAESDAVDGRVWQFLEPLSYVDTHAECAAPCARWAISGVARRVFVAELQPHQRRLRFEDRQLDFDRLRAVELGAGADCAIPTASDAAQPTFAVRRECISYARVRPNAPLLFVAMEITQQDMGLGVTRVRLKSSLREYFSGVVLAQTHMTMVRGMAPTLRPNALWQHQNLGELATSEELMTNYRELNCS